MNLISPYNPVFDEQTARLEAADPGADICDVMEVCGDTIDDLVYERSRELKWRGPMPPTLESFLPLAEGTPMASFFTGCGGMDLGFEAVGFRNVAAVEHNEIFCKTLRSNHPSGRCSARRHMRATCPRLGS